MWSQDLVDTAFGDCLNRTVSWPVSEVHVIAGGVVGLRGVWRAIPTRSVATGFGRICVDHRRVLVQERLAEAATVWAFSALVLVVTAAGGNMSAADWVYRVAVGALPVLAVLTALTGAPTRVGWFRTCPVTGFGTASVNPVPGSVHEPSGAGRGSIVRANSSQLPSELGSSRGREPECQVGLGHLDPAVRLITARAPSGDQPELR